MSHQFVCTLDRLKKVVPPDKVILSDITLAFLPGAKIGVLGHNGAGKSTLLRIMAGVDTDIQGECRTLPGLKIGYLPQEPELDPSKNVLGNIEEAVAETRALLERYEAVSARFAEPMSDDEMNALIEEQGKLQDRIEAANAWELDRQLEIAMDALRCPSADADVSRISGGERRRVALCRLLLQKPDMLLLDEPTNHLDTESVAWLERYLKEFPGTVVAITHDRYFLDNVAGWILELDRGRGIPWEGNYSSWLEQKERRLATEEKQESARRRTLQREMEWMRMTPKARHQRSKARISQFEELMSDNARERRDRLEIAIPSGPRLGDVVVEAGALKKGFGENILIDGLDFALPRGGIVGIVGPNGAGKTTLFRMIAGSEAPDHGQLKVGDTVQLAHVDQFRDTLDPDRTVWEEISGGEEFIEVGKRKMNSRAYVASFMFKGAEQNNKVGTLSGGERNRLHLAKLLRTGGNVLLLDEPTNDLDVNTLRALEEALLEFAGCAVVISHDRWFLDRIATHMLAFEDDGQVRWFEGNYQDYEADRRSRLGQDANTPHRIRYKKIQA